VKKVDVYKAIIALKEKEGLSILDSVDVYRSKLVKSDKTLAKKYSKDPEFFTMMSLVRFHTLMTSTDIVAEWERLFTKKTIGGYIDENDSEFDILNIMALLFPSLQNEKYLHLKASIFSLFQWVFHKGVREPFQILIKDISNLKPAVHSETVEEDDVIPLIGLWFGNCFDDACEFVDSLVTARAAATN
jgi:hypothetical protein